MHSCTIYMDRNLRGEKYHVTGDIADLSRAQRGMGGFGNWNDETSSIEIVSGTFRFFEHANYQGQSWVLGPGNYPWVPDVGIPDNCISSIRIEP